LRLPVYIIQTEQISPPPLPAISSSPQQSKSFYGIEENVSRAHWQKVTSISNRLISQNRI